jgi:phosphonate transport system ATP-binding protein
VTILQVKGLTKSYNGGPEILRGLSFEISAGEFVGIIGPSGSGKSTLLRCINRLVEPSAGEILVPRSLLADKNAAGSVDVLRLGMRELRLLRRKVGMIFQQFNIVKRLSVIENVLSGALGYQPAWRTAARFFTHAERRDALHQLNRVGLLNHAYRRADELSGGEQQRVAIARTLMQRPAIVLADEPVSSLDPALSRLVLDLLQRVCREDNITALVSLHTLELTREYADRVIALKDGTKLFDGTGKALTGAIADAVYDRGEKT